MTRCQTPWFKMYSDILRDEDFLRMTQGQQLTMVKLMAHANEQKVRGSFCVDNRRRLAHIVSNGSVSLLNSTLDYLENTWGFIEREGDLYAICNLDYFQFEGVSPEREEWNRLGKKLRPVVLQRDGEVCRYCGAVSNLSIDHIYPLAHGGTSDLDNLQVLCRPCNSRKGAKIL